MLKLVLLALAILFLLPLLRRKEKPEASPQPRSSPKLPAKSSDAPSDAKASRDAKASFDALLRTVVVLVGNDWSACTVDGIKEDWARFATTDVRGFAAIPAGRHRVTTRVGDRDAALDFVLFPGDVFVRRLDRDAARWVELEGDALATERARAEGGEKGELGDVLVSYRSTMGIARVMSGKLASPEAAYEKAKATLEALVARGAAIDEARVAGEALVGVALVAEQLEALAAIAKDDAGQRIVDAALPGIFSRRSGA